jgi:hypothetical protein
MMGLKSFGDVKKELRAALAKTGKDPIEWLVARIRTLERTKKRDHKEIALLQMLCRVLDKRSKSMHNFRLPRVKQKSQRRSPRAAQSK